MEVIQSVTKNKKQRAKKEASTSMLIRVPLSVHVKLIQLNIKKRLEAGKRINLKETYAEALIDYSKTL